MTEQTPTDHLTPPAGFKFNPDALETHAEQVRSAIDRAEYQAKPIPSFEGVPTVDITPTFNPTGAAAEEVYARGRIPRSFAKLGYKVRSEWTDDPSPVEAWRIVERSTLLDGTGLVASRLLHSGTLGDVESFGADEHFHSHQARRIENEDAATPFVSFSTDPEALAERFILRQGYGIKAGRNAVVVKVRVDPDRIITHRADKDLEVLLLGGVSPEEYVAAYSPADFIEQLVPDTEVTVAPGDKINVHNALGYWALHS